MSKPTVAGLPNVFNLNLIMQEHSIPNKESICLLASTQRDLLFAESTGLSTCWLGKTSELEQSPKRSLVDYVIE